MLSRELISASIHSRSIWAVCSIRPSHYTLPSCLSLRLRGEDGGAERERGRNGRRREWAQEGQDLMGAKHKLKGGRKCENWRGKKTEEARETERKCVRSMWQNEDVKCNVICVWLGIGDQDERRGEMEHGVEWCSVADLENNNGDEQIKWGEQGREIDEIVSDRSWNSGWKVDRPNWIYEDKWGGERIKKRFFFLLP